MENQLQFNTYVTPQQVQQLLSQSNQNVKIIDFRDYKSYKKSRIPQAIYHDRKIPGIMEYRQSYNIHGNIEEIMANYEKGFQNLGINIGDYIIGYENPFQMTFTTELFYYFTRSLGYNKVGILLGGIESWQQNQYELQSDIGSMNTVLEKGNFIRQQFEINNLYSSQESMLETIDNISNLEKYDNKKDNIKIIDTRSEMEYKMSHIPYSINIPFQELLNIDQQSGISPKNDLQKYLQENYSLDQNNELHIYCQKGYRSSVLFCLLKQAGYNNVKNYIGSFEEWESDLDNPLEDY